MNKKILIIFILTGFISVIYSLDIPFLSGRINDYANILDNNTVSALEDKLTLFEKKTTDQIAVLIINSLEGENLEEFSMKIAEKWKLGVKGKDNGVLLFIALDDRKLRIEVGYGLEVVLTDLKCGQIIRNVITPYFKAGNYSEGISKGVDALISVISGNDNLKNEYPEKINNKNSNSIDSQVDSIEISTRILLGLFIFGIIGLFTFIGIVTPMGGMGWILYFFLIPFWAMFPIVIVGTKITLIIVITYLISYPLLKILLGIGYKKSKFLKKFQKSISGTGANGVRIGSVSSGHFSSSSSGFSSSSSSFSGGGGSFGGGGSSGSW